MTALSGKDTPKGERRLLFEAVVCVLDDVGSLASKLATLKDGLDEECIRRFVDDDEERKPEVAKHLLVPIRSSFFLPE